MSATMESKTGPALGEKKYIDASPDGADRESLANGENTLHRSLKGRHMQMIAM
jgi:amino acid permease